jgi:GT2 family glycosyltransferase
MPLIRTAGLPVFVADAGGEVFSTARSFNRAAAEAGEWDYALLHAADTYVECEALIAGLELARDTTTTAGLTYCFDHEIRLNEWGTVAFLGGKRASWQPNEIARQSPPAPMSSAGGPRFVSRPVWDELGGFDPRFVGWGPEDQAFAWAAARVGGPPQRLGQTMLNLWHERRRVGPYWERVEANLELWRAIESGRESYLGGAGATSIRD